MSKAILVIDMPKSCDVCDFVTVDEMCGNMTCVNPLSEEYGCDVTDYIGCRAKGCPLKEVPQKKEDKSLKVVPTAPSQYTEYVKGYNACIDEIIGGAE